MQGTIISELADTVSFVESSKELLKHFATTTGDTSPFTRQFPQYKKTVDEFFIILEDDILKYSSLASSFHAYTTAFDQLYNGDSYCFFHLLKSNQKLYQHFRTYQDRLSEINSNFQVFLRQQIQESKTQPLDQKEAPSIPPTPNQPERVLKVMQFMGCINYLLEDFLNNSRKLNQFLDANEELNHFFNIFMDKFTSLLHKKRWGQQETLFVELFNITQRRDVLALQNLLCDGACANILDLFESPENQAMLTKVATSYLAYLTPPKKQTLEVQSGLGTQEEKDFIDTLSRGAFIPQFELRRATPVFPSIALQTLAIKEEHLSLNGYKLNPFRY